MKILKTITFFIFILAPLLIVAQISQTVEFATSGISIESKTAEDRNIYTTIKIPDLMFSDNIGKPLLPNNYINLIIPNGYNVASISITNFITENYILPYPIYPAQAPLSACLDCPIPVFIQPDSAIYNSINPWPYEMLEIVHEGYFDGGNHIVQVSVSPFQYYPLTGELIYYTSISFDLQLVPSAQIGISNRKRLEKNQPIYDEALKNIVANPEDIPLYSVPPVIVNQINQSGPLPYHEFIIITKNEFIPAFNGFIEWKRQKGIDIGVVSIEDIIANYIGDEIFPGDEIFDNQPDFFQHNAGRMRQYLYEAYLEGTTWVLLAGDVTVLPARWGTSDNTDLPEINLDLIIESDIYFAEFNGNWNVDHDLYFGEPTHDSPDYYQENFIGRLICSSSEDIQNWTQKVILYEQNPGKGDLSYLTNSIMTQADEFQRDQQAQQVQPHLQSFINHNIWEEYPSYNNPTPTWPKGADVITELNTNHYGLMACFNHGRSGGANSGYSTANRNMNYGDGPIYKLDAEDAFEFHNVIPEDYDGLDNLTNYNYPFVIYSLSCSQNPYHVTKAYGNSGARNFGESFTVNNLAGGVAFLGTTREAIVDATYFMFMKFADLISLPTNQYASHLGVTEAISKRGIFNHYLMYSHTLIGCPETRIWSGIPSILQVTLSHEYINIGEMTDIEISINNLHENTDAIVCLYKKDELLTTRTVTGDNNNHATILFNNIVSATSGDLHVTVTSNNYLPYRSIIPVLRVIDSDEIWDTDITIIDDVMVTSCATLTIKCVVRMGQEKKIMITPCSRIIVDNGTLKGLNNQTWQGIEVWGQSNLSQYTIPGEECAQGKLKLLNGAVIENAITAVNLWKPDDFTSTGGFVVADSATFRNNARAVHALYYHNFNPFNPLVEDGNFSSFKNCTFEITPDYPGDVTFYKHIDLNHVKGIRFSGCEFSLAKNLEGVSASNIGIAAYDAGFNVLPRCTSTTQPCTNYDDCTFTGFCYAVYAKSDLSTSYTFNVNRAIFTNNSYGIKMSLINNASILSSTFNIGGPGAEDIIKCGALAATAYGIYTDNCTGFAIEENDFTKVKEAPTGNYVGVRIANTKASDEIYNNIFDGLSNGNLAEGKNWKGEDRWEGLAYFCNENAENYEDFNVVKDDNNIGGIQSEIGSPLIPAGNTFSDHANNNFNNLSDHGVTYFYYNSNPAEYPDVVYHVGRELVSTQNLCLSHYGGGSITLSGPSLSPGQIQQTELDYASNNAEYNNVLTLYNALKDGGNTADLKTDVATAWPQDMLELRADLLAKSPHLSMEVLKETADKTDVFPESVIFEIMAANPDELKNEELIKFLEVKANPLPTYMIDILRQVSTGTTYKTVMHRQMAWYNQLKTRAAHDIIRSLLNDSVTDNTQLRNWLANLGGVRADEQIIATYMQQGSYSNALALANTMPASYAFTGNELTEHNFYMDMLNFQISIAQQGRHISELDSAELASLVYIADSSSGTAGAQARGILEHNYGYNYCNCMNVTDTLGFKGSEAFKSDAPGSLFGFELRVEPNPANEWTVFHYTMPDASATAAISITDVYGKPIAKLMINGNQGQKFWDTRSLKPGIYLYNATSNGVTKSGKIVITK